MNKAATETTLLTPAPGAFSATTGTAAVLLTDRDGQPLAGSTVTLSGPGIFSDTTNSAGCAIFGYIPAGAYTAQVSGGVTWASQLPGHRSGHRSPPAAPAWWPIEVEPPGSLRARFMTRSAPQHLEPHHGRSREAPGRLQGLPRRQRATAKFGTLDATDLFPHHDGYGVYAGSCELNNPAFWDSDYYHPGGPGYIELDPADNLKSVDVLMPSLRMSVTKTTSVARRVRVTVTQIDAPGARRSWSTPRWRPIRAPSWRSPSRCPSGVTGSASTTGSTARPAPRSARAPTLPNTTNLTPGQALDVTDPVDMTNSTGRVSGTCPA